MKLDEIHNDFMNLDRFFFIHIRIHCKKIHPVRSQFTIYFMLKRIFEIRVTFETLGRQ